jgi:hypothetical protein
LINAETDQKGYAWAKWYKNHGDDIEQHPECIKFKPNKLKFDTDKDKWYKYNFAPEFVSKIKPVYTANMLGQYKGRKATEFKINIVDIEVMSIEEAQQSTQLKHILHKSVGNKSYSDNYNILLIKRTVYKNGIFKFSLLKLLVMKYCSYIREKTWKPGSLQYQKAKFEL